MATLDVSIAKHSFTARTSFNKSLHTYPLVTFFVVNSFTAYTLGFNTIFLATKRAFHDLSLSDSEMALFALADVFAARLTNDSGYPTKIVSA